MTTWAYLSQVTPAVCAGSAPFVKTNRPSVQVNTYGIRLQQQFSVQWFGPICWERCRCKTIIWNELEYLVVYFSVGNHKHTTAGWAHTTGWVNNLCNNPELLSDRLLPSNEAVKPETSLKSLRENWLFKNHFDLHTLMNIIHEDYSLFVIVSKRNCYLQSANYINKCGNRVCPAHVANQRLLIDIWTVETSKIWKEKTTSHSKGTCAVIKESRYYRRLCN